MMITDDSRLPQDSKLWQRGPRARNCAAGAPAAGAGMAAERALGAYLLGMAFAATLILGLTGAVALALRLLR